MAKSHALRMMKDRHSGVVYYSCRCGGEFSNETEGAHHVSSANDAELPMLERLLNDPGMLRTHLYRDAIKDDGGEVLFELPKGFSSRHTDDLIGAVIDFVRARRCLRCEGEVEEGARLCESCRQQMLDTMSSWVTS